MINLQKKDARSADIQVVFTSVSGNMPLAKEVAVVDSANTAFLNPDMHPMLTAKGEASKTPSVFTGSSLNNTGLEFGLERLFEGIQTNSFFPYALYSAVARVAENELSKRAGEEKPKKSPEELEENKALREAREAWKKATTGGVVNAENPKYYTKEAHLVNPSSTYYSGAKGAHFGEVAGFSELKHEDLITIVDLSKAYLDQASEKAKEDGWTQEVSAPTPEGFREMERVKAETRHDERFKEHSGFYLDDKAYKDKLEWIESFDFALGWNIPKSEKVDVRELGKLTAQSDAALNVFNLEFCLYALNCAQLFVAPEA